MIIIGYVVVYFILGNFVADKMPPPKWPTVPGYEASWCRPHPYNKLAWKPWPFRRSRYTNEAREGDKDTCTGEIYHAGKWVKP